MKNRDPILYNRISKIESDLSNISGGGFDPSSYNMRQKFWIYDPFTYTAWGNKTTNTTISTIDSNFTYSSTTSQGTITFASNNCYINASNQYFYKPTISLSSSTVGVTVAQYTPLPSQGLNYTVPFSIGDHTIYTYMSFDSGGSQYEMGITFGYITASGGSWGVAGNQGIFALINSTLNSENIRIGKVVNGVKTYINTNTAITARRIHEFKIDFKKSTNTCEIFFNGISLGSFSISDIDTNIGYFTFGFFNQSLSNLGSGNRNISISSLYIESDYTAIIT